MADTLGYNPIVWGRSSHRCLVGSVSGQVMGQIVESVIGQLTTIPGAKVEIKLEIDADLPDGIDRNKQRMITEKGNTLGFKDNNIKQTLRRD